MPSKSGREFDFVWESGTDDLVEWTFEREATPHMPVEASPAKVDAARAIYATRRMRDRLAGPHTDLFSEPGWDLLLDLYVAHGEGRPVSVARACVAACAPVTAALGLLQTLQERALILREDHPRDQRKSRISLTIDGLDFLEHVLPDRLI